MTANRWAFALLFLVEAFGPTKAVAEDASKRPIEYRIEIPAGGAEGKKYPAVMVFGGFETAADALDLIELPEPMVLASFDYPYFGPKRIRFPAVLSEAPKLKRAIHRTIEEIPRLRRHLAAHPSVDPARITVLGASFGAPLVIYASARDPELRRLVVIHGFGRIRETIEARVTQSLARKKAWPKWVIEGIGALAGYLAWVYLDLPEIEEEARKLSAGHRTLLIEATEDEFIPRSARESLRSALAESKTDLRYHPMPGKHLGPGADELIRKLTAVAMRWLAET